MVDVISKLNFIYEALGVREGAVKDFTEEAILGAVTIVRDSVCALEEIRTTLDGLKTASFLPSDGYQRREA